MPRVSRARGPASAQPELDLNEMALRFTQGQYAAPLTCEHEGKRGAGLRRVRIDPASKDLTPPANHLIVYPLRIPEGVRCYLDTGEVQVDVAGSVTYHLEGFSRPDLAPREFQETIQREGGFTFTIKSGSLDVAGKRVEFAGGKARFSIVRPGTDPWKRLQDLDAPLKLTLVARRARRDARGVRSRDGQTGTRRAGEDAVSARTRALVVARFGRGSANGIGR